jgi:tRNA (guanine-N7-)-methyltransferase
MGNFFSWEVPKFPDRNFLWMEIKFKRCFFTAEKTITKWGENFLIIREFAQKIDSFIWDWELEQTYIHFPDPWGKKDRQKKHRLMQAEFLETLFKKTKVGWKVIFKTDHRDYFKDSLEVIEKQAIWEIQNLSFDYETENPEFDVMNITEFEAIHRREKTEINYLELVKKEV